MGLATRDDDHMEEERLPGEKLSAVVRVGDAVRRPAGPCTPTVHALLRHLRAAGFQLAPLPCCVDDVGREVLEFVAGPTVGDAYSWPDWAWSGTLLAEVASALAAFHEAGTSFLPPEPARWQLAGDAAGPICHHDLAPYNVVVDGEGHIAGIIDGDLSGPRSAARRA